MSTKFVRFVAALVVVASIVGNTGVAEGARGALPSVSAQNLEPPRAPEPQPLDIPALTIPPASSLGVQFVHVATTANITGSGVLHATVIDNPLTNGKPNAIILVTPNWNPGSVGGTNDNHPIGVWYSGGTWRIFNQDSAAMPVGAAFNVIIPTPGTNVFVHTVTPLNIGGETTAIDNALTNGNPNALLLVTPNYNPGGISCPPSCVYDSHPIGVYYSAVAGNKWVIFNQDGAAMPLNASFNVFVLTAGAGVFVQTATTGNSSGNSTYINNALTNGNPNAIVFVTPNLNPGGVGVTYENHNIGVWYDGSSWIIFNQDSLAMPLNASFNVLVLVPSSDIFVHKATAGNSAGDYTKIDNALTNGHPNAIVFTTPNYNPGGIGGMYSDYNIGVWYDGSQWAIFNQDEVTAIPAGTAFNVLVPNPDTSVFVHKATVGNSAGDYTTIDYPLTNGKSNAIILVTPNYAPGDVCGCIYDNHPIGVFYSGGKWKIFNQDLAAIPAGAAFNVTVPTARPGVDVFVQTATGANIWGTGTVIDNPLTNGNPNAIVVVTPNYDPGGACPCTYDKFPIGVWYNGSNWIIFNQHGPPMVAGTSFNVYVDANRKLFLPLVIR
jgi:hypothetical protein